MGASATILPLAAALEFKGLMDLDAFITETFIERVDVQPWISYHSDPADALGFYAAFSGTGLPIGDFMSRIIAPDVSKYKLCSLGVNDGSHIRIPEVAEGLMQRARELRPDMDKFKFVFHGLSFGGIEAQLVANYLVEHHAHDAEVVGMMLESTPSGADTVGGVDLGKKLLGQYLVSTQQNVGKGMIYATNAWGIAVDQGRRDDQVWHDIVECSNNTFASVIPDQERLINAGMPTPLRRIGPDGKPLPLPSAWYIGSDGSDRYVNVDRAFGDINQLYGGQLHQINLLDAGHASGWTKEFYTQYLADAYTPALDDITRQLETVI